MFIRYRLHHILTQPYLLSNSNCTNNEQDCDISPHVTLVVIQAQVNKTSADREAPLLCSTTASYCSRRATRSSSRPSAPARTGSHFARASPARPVWKDSQQSSQLIPTYRALQYSASASLFTCATAVTLAAEDSVSSEVRTVSGTTEREERSDGGQSIARRWLHKPDHSGQTETQGKLGCVPSLLAIADVLENCAS